MIRVHPSPFCAFTRREWERWLRAMASASGLRGLETVELFLVRDAGIAALNATRLHCPGPTNILSFPADRGGEPALVLSVDALRREALLYGQSERDHALRLLAHGMAHLAGHDHGPAMDAACEAMLRAVRAADVTP